MVKNVPYFRNLDNYIIQEIVYLLRPKRYEAGQLIVQRGDEVDQIFLLKTGCIVVEVPEKNYEGINENFQQKENIYFDWLNEGSCFCIYTGFNKDMYQLVNFRASSTCIVESIHVQDLKALEKCNIELSDILKQM
jgi:CRP-like cAMP-binding protein